MTESWQDKVRRDHAQALKRVETNGARWNGNIGVWFSGDERINGYVIALALDGKIAPLAERGAPPKIPTEFMGRRVPKGWIEVHLRRSNARQLLPIHGLALNGTKDALYLYYSHASDGSTAIEPTESYDSILRMIGEQSS